MKKIKGKKLFLAMLLVGILIGISLVYVHNSAETQEKEVKITLLATSDIHGRFMPWDYAIDEPNLEGSLTQLQTLIKKIRQENPNTILLDAGDMIQDNSAELFNDQPESPMMAAMNEMGYDVWTLGNHEFNFGLDTLKKIADQYTGIKLAGNVYQKNGERFLPASTVIERAGIKIGIIGMVTPMVTEYEKGSSHLDGIEIRSAIKETKKAVADLEGKADAVVGLVHMGLENEYDVAGTGVQELTKAVPELDAVFAGHAHELIKDTESNGIPVTEPENYGTYLSRIDLTFSKKGDHFELQQKDVTAIPVVAADGTVTESDKELETILQPYHELARADANEIVGELKGMNLVPEDTIKGIPAVQTQETPLIDFLHEVMLYYSHADVVAHQIDNDQASLEIGPIRKKDLGYNYQFEDGDVSVYKVTGQDLKDYMEWAAGYFNTAQPGDVTISFNEKRRTADKVTNDLFGNIKYEIDLSEEPGNRIKNLRKLDGTPIKMSDQLKLGMNSRRMEFLRSDGELFSNREFNKIWESQAESAYGATEGTLQKLATKYLVEELNGKYTPEPKNNWKIVGIETESPAYSAVVELVNKEILDIPRSKEGSGTNIASINVTKPIVKEEISYLSSKANVDKNQFADVKTTGEFYLQLARVLKEQESVNNK